MSKFQVLNKIHQASSLTIKKAKNNVFAYTGKADWPSTIYLSINSICNSRCKMCDVGQGIRSSQFFRNLRINGDNPVELKLSRLKKLVDEVKFFKPLISVISTEPLLYKDLFKFARYSRKNGLEFSITTNGILLEKFANDFVNNDVNFLWVSIDGPPKIHNFIRGIPGIYQKATTGVQKIQKLKQKLNKANPKIGINFTISNYNYSKIVEFMDAIMPLKPDTISISHYNYVTLEMAAEHNQKYGHICRATPSCVSAVDLKKIQPKILLKQLQEAKIKYAQKVNLGFAPDLTTQKQIFDFYNNSHVIVAKKACRAPWEIAQILANGDFTISTRCFNMSLGNINRQTFKEAWNSQEFREFRRIINQHKMFVPACTRCCAVL
ncbi:MAG: radical SAM protein [Patescibacteria group bacterium]